MQPAFRFFFSALVAFSLMTPEAAQARNRRAESPKHAAIVVDANTGKVLYASSADAARYPASLTKMMTLYMTFEALSRGKIKRSTRIAMSRHAASQPPTKLGVKPGQSITVETAVYALVTKSANDAAAALGEHLGGTEENFARMMTAKARSLGMRSTTFRNASGLPDPAQRTTARDMATLGMALRQHFPNHFTVFSARSFTYGKRRMANHNKLLGRVAGVDGIKTGYTRASGYNLVTSAGAGKKRIVAVVLGGQSGRSRDAEMAGLVNKYLGRAANGGNGALIAKSDSTFQTAAAEPVVEAAKEIETAAAITKPVAVARPKAAVKADVQTAELAAPKPAIVKTVKVKPAEAPEGTDPVQTASTGPSGWVIQIAAAGSDGEARALLGKVKAQAGGALGKATGFTQQFEKSGQTFYRARFGGFGSKTAALNACAGLKKKKIACYAIQQ